MIDGLPPGSNKIKTVDIDPEIQDYRNIQNSDLEEQKHQEKFHMIDEKKITELSREYAKDSCPVEKQQEAERVLKWLGENGYTVSKEHEECPMTLRQYVTWRLSAVAVVFMIYLIALISAKNSAIPSAAIFALTGFFVFFASVFVFDCILARKRLNQGQQL